MGKIVVLASSALILALASIGAAEVVQVPLPELLGVYPQSQTITIQLPNEPLTVRGATIWLAGEASVGSFYCGLEGPFPLPMQVRARFPDWPQGPGYVDEKLPVQPGSFQIRREFRPYRSPTWDFFMDGEAEFTFSGGIGALFGGCWVVVQPQVTLTEAVLYIDADFRVPVRTSTWGEIKALYE